jgi:hypothetical protein
MTANRLCDFVYGGTVYTAGYDSQEGDVVWIKNRADGSLYMTDEDGNRPFPHLFTFAYQLFE